VKKPKWQRLTNLERKRRNEVWQRAKAAFPVFRDPDNPVPLKIGIRADLAADIGAEDARRILAIWCRRAEYQAALIAGAPRYDLTGVPVGEVAVYKNPNPSTESASTMTQGSRADVQPRGEESGGDGSQHIQHMVWTADQDAAALPAR
jgi:sRNA-binding protein